MTTAAIETLTREHRVIEQVLASLETFALALDEATPDAKQRVADYAEFFREFADRCHHGKEEDMLFTALADHGLPADGGPVAVMLHEHEEGRRHVGALAVIGAGDGKMTAEERQRVVHHASEYVSLLRQHIQKEDAILFPAAARILPATVAVNLAEDFERHELDEMGSGAHERLHRLADELTRAYPPASATELQPAGVCGSVCGH